MKRIVIGLSNDLFVAVLSCAAVWAQATAQISGTVRGQTSAELSDAEVTLTQTDTGIRRNTLTNQTGSYVLPDLSIGPYRLEVSLSGYRTFVQTGIVLQVNANAVINAVLQAGQVSDQVQVQANAAMVETRGSGVGQMIENEQIQQLPYGRNASALTVLAGAAVQDITLNLAGGLGFATEHGLDGATHLYTYTGQSMPLPFPDTLQELKVVTSGLSAQHGQGTAVTSATKAGTNMFHGDAFEFLGNDRFNAKNYFATTRGKFRRNQFGGTLGGPIVKNKLFFFSGYQQTTLRQNPIDRLSFVPTAAMLAGDWTAFGSAACNAGRQIALRAPFANNRIDPALFSKAALNIVNRLPKSDNPCGSLIFESRTISNQNQFVGRVDYQWTDKHSLFGRYAAIANQVPHPFTFTPDNILNVSGVGVDDLFQAFAVGDTYQIGPNVVNAFHLAVNRVALARKSAKYFGPTDVGINTYSYVPNALALSVTGGFVLGGQSDSTSRTTTYQASPALAP